MEAERKDTEMMENQEVGQEAEQVTVCVDPEGIIKRADEAAAELFGCDKCELIGSHYSDWAAHPTPKTGRRFEKELTGKVSENEEQLIRADGSKFTASYLVESPADSKDKTCFTYYFNEVDEIESPANSDSNIGEIDSDRLSRVAENIRIDAPDGEMPLSAILLDLAVGHNELEQYKQGALSLYKAIDERLEEEEKSNPDSDVCEVLKEAKKTAFGLYLRVQRGDEELHGNRDGKYSGYFN